MNMRGRPDLVQRIRLENSVDEGEEHMDFSYTSRGGEVTINGKYFPYSRQVVVGDSFPNPAAERDLVEPFDKTEASLFHPIIAKRAIAATLFNYDHYGDPTVVRPLS